MEEILGKTDQCYRFPVSPEGSDRRVRTRGILSLGLASAGLMVALAWWWPGLSGQGKRSDVTVIATGEISKAREAVSRRIREAGLSVTWEDSVSSWCEASSLLDSVSTPVVVVAPDDLRPCTDAGAMVDAGSISAHEVRRWVVVAFDESSTVEELEVRGARRVATERLIGGTDEEVPCVWWDDCPKSGAVVTRTRSGLTEAGRQRLARLIVASLP